MTVSERAKFRGTGGPSHESKENCRSGYKGTNLRTAAFHNAVPNLLAGRHGHSSYGRNERTHFPDPSDPDRHSFCGAVFQQGLQHRHCQQLADDFRLSVHFAGSGYLCSLCHCTASLPLWPEKTHDLLDTTGACAAAGGVHHSSVHHVQQAWYPEYQAAGTAGLCAYQCAVDHLVSYQLLSGPP